MKRKIILIILILFGALFVFRVIQDWDGEGKGRALNALQGGIAIIAIYGLWGLGRYLFRRGN